LVQEVAGADDAVLALALSPDGQILAAGGLDRTLYLWHLGESFEIPNRPASSLETPATINGLAFNVEGTRLATAHEDNSIRVWSVEEGEGTLLSTIDASESEDNQAFDVAFTPEGDALIVANGDGTLRIWELNRLGGARDEPVDIVAHGGGVRLLAVNPADQTQFISAGADGTLRFWRLEYILQ
jgi:WD40 repeat protein